MKGFLDLPRLWIAAIAAVAAALGVAPAAAQAAVGTTNISSWTSNSPGTPANSRYLISYDNQPTTLAIKGTAPGATNTDHVDIACYYGPPAQSQFKTLASNLPVTNGGFATTAAPQLRAIAGHACRLRAVPHDAEPTSDLGSFAGPSVAVAEVAALPTISGGRNDTHPYNYYVNAMTFSGFAAWKAVGTPANRTAGTGACGGPYAAPVDEAFDIGNFPIDCAGSLLSNDLGIFGGRSEVQIDGANAYDAASAQALFARTGGQDNGSEDLPGFPALSTHVIWDPSTGDISSQAQQAWVACNPSDTFPPTAASCLSFQDTGVALTRVVTTSDGGRVITVTDAWSSTDEKAHSLDLLYDDYTGVSGNADSDRGWQFPGQAGFAQYSADTSVPAPASAPGSILTRTNVTAADGDPSEGFGAITFGQAPTGYRFASPSELEEHQLVTVPAGGAASLSYVYSVGYSQADVTTLAMVAQDRFQPPVVRITSVAGGSTVSAPTVTLAGMTAAGSGIKSLRVAGQPVPVGPGGAWSAQVALSPGANTITALATDGAGAQPQASVTVVYQPPSPPPAAAKCKVPRTKGMKVTGAKKALRRAHCRVGKVKQVSSSKVRRGRVMSTTPRAGRRLPLGSKVELFVSKGPKRGSG